MDNFVEREWTLSIITETWFVTDAKYEQTILDLKNGHGIGAICLNRTSSMGRNSGGGVAVMFRKSKGNFTAFPAKKNGCEIVTAKGKIAGDNRTIFVIGVYMPPGMRRIRVEKYINTIHDIITKMKIQERNPRYDKKRERKLL